MRRWFHSGNHVLAYDDKAQETYDEVDERTVAWHGMDPM